MDVHLMGDLDGIEAAQAIKALRVINVLFVTAHSDPDTTRRMSQIVPGAPLTKPISEAGLLDAIMRVCQ
jgi:DNA-binding NarL/FixJ family response regulator